MGGSPPAWAVSEHVCACVHVWACVCEATPLKVASLTVGEGNGNPLQYSCLENPVDRGAWWAALGSRTESDTTEETAEHACMHATENSLRLEDSSVPGAILGLFCIYTHSIPTIVQRGDYCPYPKYHH